MLHVPSLAVDDLLSATITPCTCRKLQRARSAWVNPLRQRLVGSHGQAHWSQSRDWRNPRSQGSPSTLAARLRGAFTS